MNISGKYLHKKELLDCCLTIKNGKIYTIDIDNDILFNLFLSSKNHSSDFELIDNIETENDTYNSNYILKYFGGFEKPQLIYLNLNLIQVILLKYAMRKWLIQSKDIKIEILKYCIIAVLGFLGGKIVYQQNNIGNTIPATIPKNIPTAGAKTSLEHKNLKTDNKKDTIIINNLKNASHLKGGETKPE